MKLTQIMLLFYSIIALFFNKDLTIPEDCHNKESLFFISYWGFLTPLFILIIIAIIEKMRIDIADKTEKKAFFIAKILSNILFYIFYIILFAFWSMFMPDDGTYGS